MTNTWTGKSESRYVEFKQSWRTTRSDTTGHCTYALEGTDCKFHIQVNDEPSNIKVRLENIETPNNANGSWINLGWEHDGIKYFIMSGKQGAFSSSNPPSDWMHQNIKTLGPRTLSHICMPGTHDAGMGEITWSDNIPTTIIDVFTQTQSRKIFDQLQYGSRYFDIRPEISSGETWTGHYGDGKLGARGQKMSSIIDDINNFTANNKELIILNFSHAKQTDADFRDYNQDDWNKLMEELLRINNRSIQTGPLKDDLSLLRLDQFISDRAAVVIVIEASSNITLDAHPDQGFYLPAQLNIRNEYSNTDDCVNMVHQQIQKLETHADGNDKRMFLLSWTLTQQAPDVNIKDFGSILKILKQVAGMKSIRQMAYSANKALLTDLFPRCSVKAFPNIVYIDYMENNNYAALAMAINQRYGH